ncbi:MAG TPA: response regulator [Polyangia bacterium]|nr:response regulator [Polyangia bacterium]
MAWLLLLGSGNAPMPNGKDDRPRILVVDTDRQSLGSIERLLTRLGFHVLVSADAAEAITLASEHVPAVALVEIHLPGLSGHALVQRMRQAQPTLVPIMMSARADSQDMLDSFSSGAIDYLRKPFNPRDLVTLVARAVASHEQSSL